MGGNAIKNCVTKRLNREEYDKYCSEVTSHIRSICKATFPSIDIAVVRSYANKETFGDIDVLVSSDYHTSTFNDKLAKLFKSKEVVNNGNVSSFEYNEVQVDIIVTPYEDMEASINYFAYNDLGNLMGRIAHKQGIKYGHRGSMYVFRDDLGNVVDEFLITREFSEFCNSFDFDYNRYLEGFDTLEDIFEFVSKSKYFNPDIYLLDNLNHKSRIRDAKRATYNKFLSWCAEKKDREWNGRKFFEYDKPKKSYLPRLFDDFMSARFRDKWFEVYKNNLVVTEFKKKFNGRIVQENIPLSGERLGKFIAFFKARVDAECGWDVFLALSSKEEIEEKLYGEFSRFFREKHM